MKIQSICVCGAGTMGSGIAQVCASAGFPTIVYELNAAVLQKAKASIEAGLEKLAEKGKLTVEEIAQIASRLTYTSDVAPCKADLVIEAIVEKPEAKVALLSQVAALNGPDTILASNTSSLSISVLAAQLPGPERVAGLHFFNPAPLMRLVEVVRGEQTSEAVVTALTSFTRQVGKTPVVCKDAPGFIVNRVARPFYIESLRIAEEGRVELPAIDRLLEARGFKMGPFRLMDLIGNDVNYAVSCSVYEQLHQPERLKPSYLQQEKVEKGELGRKTRKGYYEY